MGLAVSLAALVCCSCFALAAQAQDFAPVTLPLTAPVEPAVPISLKPYEVRIEITYGQDPRFTQAYRAQVRAEMIDAAYKTMGQGWNIEITEGNDLAPGRLPLERVTPEMMLARTQLEKFDKVFLLSIEPVGAQLTVWAVEWDRASRKLGQVESVDAWQRRELPDRAFALVRRLFTPLLSIERVRGEIVDLQVRAGGFPAPDSRAEQVSAGDWLAPVFRHSDRKGKVTVAGVPWTYMNVEKVERDHVTAKLITVLRNPLGGKSRRIEKLGVRLRPTFAATNMKLNLASRNPVPLVGHQVNVYPKTQANDKPKSDPLELVSDRRGIVAIPFDAKQPLVWLYVRSGKALLARVPYLPGVRENDSLSLYDDSMRLAVEGELRLLNGRVIDAVARRMSHVIAAQVLAEQKKWKEVDAELAALEGVPGIAEFQRQLNAIQQPALQAADIARNKRARASIEQLCKDASALIDRHLAESTIKERVDAIRALRAAAG